MIKSIRLLLLVVVCCAVISCGKNDDGNDDPADVLANTTWQATLTDENPATNPPGKFRYVNEPDYDKDHQYYYWQDCQMDDTFAFKNSHFAIDDNGSECLAGEDLILDLASQPYVYDAASKKLTIGTGDDSVTLDVYEINESRLKIGITLAAGGLKYIVFLFKKK